MKIGAGITFWRAMGGTAAATDCVTYAVATPCSMVTTRMVSGRNGTRTRRTFIADQIARTRANRSFLGHDDPVAMCIFLRTGGEDEDDDLWKPTNHHIDVLTDEDDDTNPSAEKYLVEENWDDDDEDAWLSVHIKPNTPSAIVTSHTWTVFPLHSGIGKTGMNIFAGSGFGAKALTGCYIFTATGKNSANADILSKIVWKVDPVCTGLSCPKITGEFVGLDHEICIDKSGRIEKVTGPTSALLSDGAAPKATAAATLLAIAATAVVF